MHTNVRATRTQHVHSMYTACTQHVHSMYTACTQHVHSMYTACTQHVHSMYTACTQHVHSMYTACTQHVHSMYTACTQHVHSILWNNGETAACVFHSIVRFRSFSSSTHASCITLFLPVWRNGKQETIQKWKDVRGDGSTIKIINWVTCQCRCHAISSQTWIEQLCSMDANSASYTRCVHCTAHRSMQECMHLPCLRLPTIRVGVHVHA